MNLARQMAGAYGWRGRQWGCLKRMWNNESHFRNLADNKKSTAFGIAQMLGEKSKEPAVQIVRALRYIEVRYDTPCKALAFWNRHQYY